MLGTVLKIYLHRMLSLCKVSGILSLPPEPLFSPIARECYVDPKHLSGTPDHKVARVSSVSGLAHHGLCRV